MPDRQHDNMMKLCKTELDVKYVSILFKVLLSSQPSTVNHSHKQPIEHLIIAATYYVTD